MKKLARKELIIGICVIGALLILFFGIDYLKGINLFRPANFYVAEYENVAGLEVAAAVTIDGYKVGQVREINFDYANPTKKVEVILALDNKLHLPKDSKAVIASTLLNGGYIELQVGHSKEMLPEGSKIATGTTPDLMATVTDQLLPSVVGIVPEVDALLKQLNQLAQNLNTITASPAIYSSIARLDGISANLLSTSASLNNTMGGLQNNVPAIMGDAKQITGNINNMTKDLGELSYQLKNLPIQTTMGNVQEVTANLQRFSEQLNNPNSSLGLLMNDPELYTRLTRISADVDSLIVDIQRNPKRYISIKLF